MKKRTIEEIKNDIEIYEKEYKLLSRELYLKGKSYLVNDLNALSKRIKSLKLELNRTRLRNFGTKDK